MFIPNWDKEKGNERGIILWFWIRIDPPPLHREGARFPRSRLPGATDPSLRSVEKLWFNLQGM